jgi:hypothetical protein
MTSIRASVCALTPDSMTTITRCLITFAAAVFLFTLTGCNTVSTRTTPFVGVPSYPPTDPATVQITRAQPTQAHVQIGEIVCEPSSLSTPVPKIEAKLQQAGAKLGANAVVIVADRTQSVGAVVMGGWYSRQVSPIIGRVIVGVAIRYTQ